MSGMELLAIVGCVAAVCSAYRDGSELLRDIKERRKLKKERRAAESSASMDEVATKELEVSLTRGEVTIRGQYEHNYKRMGEAFRQGDQIAREELKDVIIYLQSQVISNLKIAWKQDASVDFHLLERASDDSQDRAIMCLLNLHQRLLVAAPIDQPLYSPPPPPVPAKTPITPIKRNYTPGFVMPVQPGHEVRSTTWAVTTQPANKSPKSSPPIASTPTFASETEKKKPFAGVLSGFRKAKASNRTPSTPKIVEEPAPFQERPKPNVQSTQPDSDYVLSQLNQSPRSEYRFNRINSTSTGTSGSSIMETEHELSLNPWDEKFTSSPKSPSSRGSYGMQLVPDSDFTEDLGDSKKNQANNNTNWNQADNQQINYPGWNESMRRSPPIPDIAPLNIRRKANPTHSRQVSSTLSDPGHGPGPGIHASRPGTSMTNRSNPESITTSTSTQQLGAPITAAPYLPNEENNYSGLCKGAWLQQIGMPKKAMQERARPASVYVTMQTYWKCKSCNFEGRMFKDAKNKPTIDTRVFNTDGIRYRWEFLFKSHVPMKETIPNPITSSNFGCIFCCAEGKGMPIFGGVNAFMEHLQEHRGRPPMGEVLYRMKIITGRLADATEAFDVNLPPV